VGGVKEFAFVGTLEVSKSLLNRALICQSYQPRLQIEGDSSCDDVTLMKIGLQKLRNYETSIYCGHGGTVLRFLALRASRQKGEFVLSGSERLFARPHDELLTLLRQLGVDAEISSNNLILSGEGWRPRGDAIHINSVRSSQFVTSLALNSWGLSFQLAISPGRRIISPGYWEMTLKLLRSLGMRIEKHHDGYIVPARQSIEVFKYNCEIDLSSAFAIAALGAINGQVAISNFPKKSIQPDRIFVELLSNMGARVKVSDSTLQVSSVGRLGAINFDLNKAPDLFLILSVLCAHAEGESNLVGAKQLKYKESNRIQGVSQLLKKINCDHQVLEDGLIIKGPVKFHSKEFEFDCDHDHRMAMAAGLLKRIGYNIKILGGEEVNKSFPQFWQYIGVDHD